ncbi:hypothetical protein O181_061256 [Austropuccinia psidii MF-1]|uniref:Uncharacterized protein n=1 Tax=Austropuccinia psidii MF-1 TaxID=1389203 RepID=A0A9Q3EMF5_9BASI|nr:hypothetical protein [Austropuccinia psidii MF-1]
MITTFCDYGLEYKDSDGLFDDWCTLITALKLEYKTSIHCSTGNTPAFLGKGCNYRIPHDTFKKDLVDIHLKEESSKIIRNIETHHANRFMQNSFKYAQERWENTHKLPGFKIDDLVSVLTLSFNNIKRSKKLKNCFEEPSIINLLHGPNTVCKI